MAMILKMQSLLYGHSVLIHLLFITIECIAKIQRPAMRRPPDFKQPKSYDQPSKQNMKKAQLILKSNSFPNFVKVFLQIFVIFIGYSLGSADDNLLSFNKLFMNHALPYSGFIVWPAAALPTIQDQFFARTIRACN